MAGPIPVSSSKKSLPDEEEIYDEWTALRTDCARAESESDDGASSPRRSPPSGCAQKKQPAIPGKHTGAAPDSTAVGKPPLLLRCTDLILLLHCLLPQDLVRYADPLARHTRITYKALTKALLESSGASLALEVQLDLSKEDILEVRLGAAQNGIGNWEVYRCEVYCGWTRSDSG
ncbi:hypothetical protein LTR95_002010 [Oleoguttula sp. CCFEE 5521]